MAKYKSISFLLLLFILFLTGCNQDKWEKYERPSWLAGKVYTQVLERPELSTFAKCIELTGYDTIINTSGTYTVFAPSNDAFSAYFQKHSKYKKVEDISPTDLARLVKYHIVQNPWSKLQLRSLDIRGWIDTLNIENNQPKGFKRETLLLDKDIKYGVTRDIREKKIIITDTTKSQWYRKGITDSRKYVPFFFQEYFGIYDLNSTDYQFYFNRPFEGGSNIYFANAKIVSDEIFAENGFVYVIDQVVEPLQSGLQFLTNPAPNNYSEYVKLLYLFPNFQYNNKKTFEQPGADKGLKVDSLFDLTFPELEINVSSERTRPPKGTFGLPSNVTIRYHHGLMAPTNDAFNQFVNQYIKIPNGWGTLDGAPLHIKRIIANTYLSTNPIYPTDFKKGFLNGEADRVTIDESQVVQKNFGSNCTFIGLKQAVVPRAFKSITGPIYLQQGYSKIMYAIETTGLLPALKRENKNYMLFVEPDSKTSQDSSFMMEQQLNQFRFSVILIMPGNFTRFYLTQNDIRNFLLNHVATDHPKGKSRKEFIFNLAGNIITFNNLTGEISGTAPSTIGYNGSKQVPVFASKISTNADNGSTYEINNWLNFSTASLFAKISSSYPKFHALMQKAGFSIDKEFRYNFISNNDNYTVFIPTEDALNEVNANSMPIEQLRKFLQLHFVQGQMIFTDGNKPSGYYETVRIDEKSTPFSTVYTSIYIEPGVDVIRFPGKTGNVGIEVTESDKTNIITGVVLGTGQEIFPASYNNGVIHSISKALTMDNLKTN